ncbi:ricin-type beta-trefoil lectin domain protein [Kistimonas asteriae]|uniref:ricin-type beta-trefoil lectin domain protein n=1 Tax=Kistimonas asteriae TaxID=517724 RepID=UPI001BADF94D|nr:ricin-type beta-trefoil lectin domain protein [Kistimonas asteriae]
MPPSCITVHNQKKKKIHQQKILILLLLPSINIAASLHNNTPNEGMIIQHGSLSTFGQTLQEQLQIKMNNNDLPFQLFYINTDSLFTEKQTFEIRQLLNASHTIILDGTTSSPETIQTTSAAIGGIGLSSPVIMIRGNQKAFPEYKHIVIPASVNAPPPEVLNRLADESYRLLTTWRAPLYHARSAERQKSRWRPEASISIEQRHIDLSCMVGSKFESRQGNEPDWTEGKTDACDHAASLSLSYTVDLIRSVPTYIADTQDLKYLRITVDPETNGGAGWHLVDAPMHKHTWFESWTNRETWFGPIADRYTIQVHPLDPDVRLHNAIPANTPKQSHITERSAIQVGVMGQFIFLGPEIIAYQPDDNIEEQEEVGVPSGQDAVNDQASSATDNLSDQSEAPPPIEIYSDAPGTSSEQNKEHSKSYYALPKEEAKKYYLKLIDDHFDTYLYELWKEILEVRNQPITLNGNNQPLPISEQIKNQLLSVILMETMGNINQHNVDRLVSARNYWYTATATSISPSVIQAYKDNPTNFKYQRPEFLRPYPFYSFKSKTTSPQTKDTFSSNTHSTEQTLLDPPEKPVIQNSHTYRSPLTPVTAFTYSSERSINYKNHEYILINQSRADTADYAAWTWSRDFPNASKHWRTHITCPLWCQDWFFDNNAFSPAAYASFTPGFSSTFAVPARKTDLSTLILTVAIKPVALGGRIQYRFIYQDYGTWGQSGRDIAFNQVITVNWGSSVFNPEAPVIIKMHNKNLCLNVREGDTKGNGQVNLYKCRYSESQIWGQDQYHRLKAHSDAQQCLTKRAHNIIMLDTCNNTSNQKWFWDDQLLRDTDGCYLFTDNNLSLAVTCDPNEATRWIYQVKKPVTKGAITILPL